MVTFRELVESDSPQVMALDCMSGSDVASWLECGGAYGAFADDTLVAYLTIGGADDCGEEIESNGLWGSEAKLLSDVYVREDFRGQAIGMSLIQYVLHQDCVSKVPVYLSVLYDELFSYYSRLGFLPIGGYCMVWVGSDEGMV